MGNGERNASAGGRTPPPEAIDDVLASIRALVTAETSARLGGGTDEVLMLTPDMRVEDQDEEEPARSGEVLVEGLDAPDGDPAPILDEEAIRSVVNRIVREELQGELGDRISRNLRKLIRREIVQIAAERQERLEEGRD
jgi:hypothetical protein